MWTDGTLKPTYHNSSSSLQHVYCRCWYCNNAKISRLCSLSSDTPVLSRTSLLFSQQHCRVTTQPPGPVITHSLSAPAQHSILADTWLCVDKAQNCTRVNDCLQRFMYIKLLDTDVKLASQLETYGRNENLIIHHMTLMLGPSKANSNIAVHPWWYRYQSNSNHFFVTQTGTYSSPSKSLKIHMQIHKTETVFPWFSFIWSLKAGSWFYW